MITIILIMIVFIIIYDANNDNHVDNNVYHFDQIVNAAKNVDIDYDFYWHVYIIDDYKKISSFLKKIKRIMMIIFI